MEFDYSRHRRYGSAYQLIPVDLTGRRPLSPDFRVVEDRCYFDRLSEIWDCRGSKRDYHPCKQTTVYFSQGHFSDWELDVTGSPGTYPSWKCYPFWIPRSPYLFTSDSVKSWLNSEEFDQESGRWQQFTAAAFESITQQTPEIVDLPNLLRDIFTLKGLFRQIVGLLRKLWKLLQQAGGFLRQHFVQTLTLRQILKNCADGYLINEFGIQPLIREVIGLATKSVTALRRLEFLRKTQGSVISARYAESQPFEKGDVELGVADAYGFGNTLLKLKGISGVIKYTCTAKVKNDLKGLNDFLSGVKIYLGALRVGNLATFVWDLVPFSFVVDWFANVSGLLDRYASVSPFSGELKVLSAGTGFKKVCSGEVVLYGPLLKDGEISLGRLYYKEYERRAGLDTTMDFLSSLSALTPKQLKVLTAIVLQRL